MKRMIVTNMLGLAMLGACGEERRERRSQIETDETASQMVLKTSEPRNAIEGPFEPEACSLARPGDCVRVPNVNAKKEITVCGHLMTVPVLSYLGCQTGVGLIPASCTAGSALTAGGACLSNVALVAAACAVSVDAARDVAECCIQGGC